MTISMNSKKKAIKITPDLNFHQEILDENQKLSEKCKRMARDFKLLSAIQKQERKIAINQITDEVNSKIVKILIELNYLKFNNTTEEQFQQLDHIITLVMQLRDDTQMIKKRWLNSTYTIK